MDIRVEQLSAQADVSVATIRYYQSKGLLSPPRREGRIAWYGDEHLERLTRIRTFQHRGFTLATISRLVSGELDAADEALLSQLSGLSAAADEATGDLVRSPAALAEHTYSIDELATRTAMPLALLKALEAEGHGPVDQVVSGRDGVEHRADEHGLVRSRGQVDFSSTSRRLEGDDITRRDSAPRISFGHRLDLVVSTGTSEFGATSS